MEIWLVILFLSRKTFHAEQIFVLSSAMKLGPGLLYRQSASTTLARLCLGDDSWTTLVDYLEPAFRGMAAWLVINSRFHSTVQREPAITKR